MRPVSTFLIMQLSNSRYCYIIHCIYDFGKKAEFCALYIAAGLDYNRKTNKQIEMEYINESVRRTLCHSRRRECTAG